MNVLDQVFSAGPHVVAAIVLLPIVAFVLQYVFGRKIAHQSHWISIAGVGGSWVLATALLIAAVNHHDPKFQVEWTFTWFTALNTPLQMGILLDNLAAGMLFTVTFISLMVHVYSVGYMHDDPLYWKFFAYLSLFTFSMLGLVATNNTFGLYCFWELVGVSSYLLIGFWFHKPSAANACLKAFITNRVGDVGFFMGLVLLYTRLGTFRYTELFAAIDHRYGHGEIPLRMLTVAGVLIFCGAVGKSAQFPLHVWLPDAMEGPTPVSALIHAATMVAAGVYMVARLYPIFTPKAFLVIATIGLITAVMAGLIALAQNDIKRVLAYSTVSQLGYMVTSLGVGGYTAGMFHLSTHAFFKALLFLCSGSVIHAVHTQDMREMGGLRTKMPVTFWAMLIATLAICGVPFFAGFYSKDEILAAALTFGVGTCTLASQQHWGFWWMLYAYAHWSFFILLLLAAGVTSYYSFRLIFMTFFGVPRDKGKHHHAHESAAAMAVPLCILMVFAVTSGYGKGVLGFGAIPWQDSALGKLAAWGSWYGDLVRAPDMPILRVLKTHGYTWGGQANEGISAAMAGPGATGSAAAAGGGGETAAGEAGIEQAGAREGAEAGAEAPGWIHTTAMWLSILMVFLGITVAYLVHIEGRLSIAVLKESAPPLGLMLEWLYPIFENKFYFDEIYEATWIAMTLLSTEICAWIDRVIIDGLVNASATVVRVTSEISGRIDLYGVDGLVNGIADCTQWFGRRLRTFQDGRVQDYLVYSFAVVVAMLAFVKLPTW